MTDNAHVPDPIVVDEKGRPTPEFMSERDMLMEMLGHMRAVADTVEELADSPMVQMLQGGGNPLTAIFGR